MSLSEYREKIDIIDNEILELFQQRMDIVKDVAKYKLKNNLEIFHPEREKEILTSKASASQEEYKEYVYELFSSIMEISKEIQLKVINSKK